MLNSRIASPTVRTEKEIDKKLLKLKYSFSRANKYFCYPALYILLGLDAEEVNFL